MIVTVSDDGKHIVIEWATGKKMTIEIMETSLVKLSSIRGASNHLEYMETGFYGRPDLLVSVEDNR